MEKYAAQLYAQMETMLLRSEKESGNPLECSKQSIEIVRRILQRLRKYILRYKFKGKPEEIKFFKQIKPRFYCKLIYYLRVFHIETHSPAASYSLQEELLQGELKRIRYFFQQNMDFFDYYTSDADYMDEQLFTRGHADLLMTRDEYAMVIDPEFCTVHSYKLSQILAYSMLQQYLDQALMQLDLHRKSTNILERAPYELEWTGSKTSLVELLYALQSAGVFNHGQADIRKIAGFLAVVFHVRLGNYYRVFQEIRLRKKNKTSFLDNLRQRLIRRIEENELT